MRWGLSPVFIYECLANSRRWQNYAVRSIGVAILLVAVASIAMSQAADRANSWRNYAALGESYFYAIIGIELTLVLLAAPAATAGAICVDRARGTLTHMLVTELSDPEIVLGKLGARLLPVLGLVACTWPVLAISSLLGGIDPTALTLAFLIILAVALVGCSLALALSVWARKPHEVVMMTYFVWILVLIVWPTWYVLSRAGLPAHWTFVANPYYLAFARYATPNQTSFWDYIGFFAAALGASGLLILVAVQRMRPVARRGNVQGRKESAFGLLARLTRWLPGPALDLNPVLWREWHRTRPSRPILVLVLVTGGATGIACLTGAVTIWANGVDFAGRSAAPIAGIVGFIVQLTFGLLMLSAVAPMSMSEESARGSLDLLATTALSTRAIVLGKWLGTLRLVFLLTLGPGLVGLALATAYQSPVPVPPPTGVFPDHYERLSRAELLFGAALLSATVVVHGALIAGIGLAMATWIKRQSRAIATSVALAVMLIAGWPILIGVSRMGMPGQGMMCLSPVVAANSLAETLLLRHIRFRTFLWWIAFWDIASIVMALGLLWLTVRTFDGCFGRMPERAPRAPVLSDVVVVLATLLGVGSLFGAVTIGIGGLGVWRLENLGVLTASILVTCGFVALSALAVVSTEGLRASRAWSLEPAGHTVHRELFARRWWESFRLVLLLAIGPAFIALALATGRMPVHVLPAVKKLPGGVIERIETHGTGNTYVTTTDAAGVMRFRFPTAAEMAAATPIIASESVFRFLSIALVALLTIPFHGAAFVSLGLALGIWVKSRTRAIAASVCMVLVVTVGSPIVYALFYPSYPWGVALASLPCTLSVLLINIRSEQVIAENLWLVATWDVFFILLAITVSALAIRTLDRRSSVDLSVAENSPVEPLTFDPSSSRYHAAANLSAR